MFDRKMWSLAIVLVGFGLSGFTLQQDFSSSDTPSRELNEMPAPSVMVPLELYASLRPGVEQGYIFIYQTKDMVRIELASFDSGSDRVRPESASVLAQIGSVLKTDPHWKATLTGHADSQEIRPSLQKRFPTNQELSEARAQNGARILKAAGADPHKISVTGKGESQPIASNATEEGRSMNRRIEIIVAAR